MRFDKIIPTDNLKPYVKYLAVSENSVESRYKVFPSTGLVIGFQYRGELSAVNKNVESKLAPAGITGIADSFKIFKNSPNIGTILVCFTEIGPSYFSSCLINELFNQSISFDNIFDKNRVSETEEKISCFLDRPRTVKLGLIKRQYSI